MCLATSDVTRRMIVIMNYYCTAYWLVAKPYFIAIVNGMYIFTFDVITRK